MIRKIKYESIDFEKYNHCIAQSCQRKFYAERSFLDISTGKNWEILVYGDYEAVMPIPLIRKLGVKVVINPKLCQQLGIFSKQDSKVLNDNFLDFFRKYYKIWYYAFNDVNEFSKPLKQRNNFLIFPEPYDLVRQRYSPKRKRKLRLDQEVIDNSEMIKNPDLPAVQAFIRKTGLGAGDRDLEDFIRLLSDFNTAGFLDFYGFYYHHQLINLVAVYHNDYTLALLGTYNDREYVKLSGSSYLIDKVIADNIADKIFDFEGSEVPAVEEFFRGFRPALKPYSCIQYSKKELLQQIFVKFFR